MNLLRRNLDFRPQLRTLAAVGTAAPVLYSVFGLVATGHGTVCFRSCEDPHEQDDAERIAARAGDATTHNLLSLDPLGRTTVRCWRHPGDLLPLLADLADVAGSLARAGFGRALVRTTVDFTDRGHRDRTMTLVQRMPIGTFYPFVRTGPRARNRSEELRVRGLLAAVLPIEADSRRWLPV